MDGGAYNLFGSEINAVYDLWNGIDSDFNIDSINVTGDPDDYEIVIEGTTNINPLTIGQTWYYDANGNGISNEYERSSVLIELNNVYLSLKHEDIQKEVILHELGHAAGLAHVINTSNESSVCIMQQTGYYCYPSPTSHDRQTLDSKY